MTSTLHALFRPLFSLGLIPQIAIGIVLGILLAIVSPGSAQSVSLLGQLFVSALMAVAPILVFILVAAAIAGHRQGQPTHIKGVLMLYVIGTLVAALVAVVASFAFPTTLTLHVPAAGCNPPGGIAEILSNLLLNAVAHPVPALREANFIAILACASGLALILRHGSETPRRALHVPSTAVSGMVLVVIRVAALQSCSLVAST